MTRSRAALGLLDWNQQELADAARIGMATIRLFEGAAPETVRRRSQCYGERLSEPV